MHAQRTPSKTRFKEALLLDCDVVLMRDPAYLFDAPEYRASGNLLWGDIYGEGMFQDKAFDYIGARESCVLSLP